MVNLGFSPGCVQCCNRYNRKSNFGSVIFSLLPRTYTQGTCASLENFGSASPLPGKTEGAYDNKSEKQISSIQYLETFIFNLWIWKKHWYPYKKPSAEKACPSLGRNYQSHDIITMPPLIIEWTLKEIISSVKARPSPIKNSITLIIICTELDNRGDEESRNKFFLLIYL